MRVRTAYFEITNRCNLNCRTCYNRSGLNRETVELSPARLYAAIRLLRAYGLERCLLSGGEPTLHRDFDSVLALADAYPDLTFGVVTNGTTADRRLADRVNATDGFILQISLDGSCDKINSLTRGEGAYDKALAFARMIRNPNADLRLKTVLSQQTFDDIEPYYLLALSLGFTPEFAFIYKSGNGSADWDAKCLTARQKLAALSQIERLNKAHGVNAALPLCTSKCPFATGHGDADLSLSIKVDGTIQPCQSLYGAEFSLGNIFSFDEKAFSARLDNILTLARRRAETDYGCERCMLREACGHGCMAEAAMLTGDPLGNDGGCEYRKMQFISRTLSPAKRLASAEGKR